jgi:hypothetical protein
MPNAATVVGVRRERHRAHEKVAGEPVARKAGTAGSGRGPLEKDLNRHLASGLPVLNVIKPDRRERVDLGPGVAQHRPAVRPAGRRRRCICRAR